MIKIKNFVAELMITVDKVIDAFVQTGYQNLVQNNMTVLTLMMTFYIGWLGYKFASHTLSMEINELSRHLMLLIIVYALITQWDLFFKFVYNIFTNEPAAISKTLIDASGNSTLKGESTASALNAVFSQGMDISKHLLHQFTYQHLSNALYGLLVALATAAQCLFALSLMIYAKMAMAVMLFLAPMFISFLLWSSTRKLFDSWLQALLNYALIPIITCGILMLTLSTAHTVLPDLSQMVDKGDPEFSGVFPYLGVSLISALLFKQVLPICAALSAGLALEGISSAAGIAKQAFAAIGGNKALGSMRQGAQSAGNKISGHINDRKAARAQASRDKKTWAGI